MKNDFSKNSDESLLTKSRILLAQLKRKNDEIEKWHNCSVKEWHKKDRDKINELLLDVNEELERRGLAIPT